MARKDRPYLPLYVQDILTDEKLIECSAIAHGVYLRLLCLLHKQETYGLLCLKQKYKQIESKNVSKVYLFACMLCRQMPFEQKIIEQGLQELLDEDVIQIEGDNLSQKRMVADGNLSSMRAEIGKTGGSNVTKQYGKSGFLYWIGDNKLKNKIGVSVNIINRLYRLRSDLKLKKLEIIDSIEVIDMGKSEDEALLFFNDIRDGEWIKISHNEMAKKFALLKAKIKANSLAKVEANAEIDIDIDIVNKSIKLPIVKTNNGPVAFINSMKERFVISNPNYSASDEDFGALFDILNFIRGQEKIESAMHDLKPEEEEKIKVTWDKWIPVIIKKFLNKSLSEVSRFKKTEISNIVKNGSVTKQKDILNGNGDLKGAKFSDNFLEVIFPDGSTQKLNKDQSRQAEYGMLKANSITKGIMN